jgi:osomolarity two-component system, response regulator SKN7
MLNIVSLVLQSWTFRHPDFHAERRDALENIKRKVPAQRKSLPSSTSNPPIITSATAPTSTHPPTASPSTSHPHPHPLTATTTTTTTPTTPAQALHLQSQIDRLTRTTEDQAAHIRSLERNYQDVLVEMVNFQRNMAQQDGLMQNLIQYFLGVENGA